MMFVTEAKDEKNEVLLENIYYNKINLINNLITIT
jgi:hypothetical protein